MKGVSTRKKWWKAFLPIFAVQFVLMNLLGTLIPDLNPPRWALPKSRGSKADWPSAG
jgi:quinol-cytochrome oxidoreductase complex cytochrome b subunit